MHDICLRAIGQVKTRIANKNSEYFDSNRIQTYLYMLNRYGIRKETNEHLATHYKNALKALFYALYSALHYEFD